MCVFVGMRVYVGMCVCWRVLVCVFVRVCVSTGPCVGEWRCRSLGLHVRVILIASKNQFVAAALQKLKAVSIWIERTRMEDVHSQFQSRMYKKTFEEHSLD